MRKTFLVMRQELVTTLQRKMFLFFAIILPVVMGLIAFVVSIANRDQGQTAETEQTTETADMPTQGYIDQAGLVASEAPGLPPGVLLPFEDETAANAALEAGDIDGYFIISADYLEGGKLIYVTNEFNLFEGTPGARPVEWLLLTNLLDDPAKAAAVWQPINLEVRQLAQPGAEETGIDESSWISELLPTLMVFIIYMTIIIPAGALVTAVTDEKKNRVIETVLVSVSSRQFITGKILALGILGLLQVGIWITVIYGVVRFGGQSLNIPEGFTIESGLLFWVIVYSLLGYLMYGVLMAGLGALAPDVKDARGATFMMMIPLIVAYMFNIVVLERPNDPIALILSLFPLTAPVSMVGRMAVSTVPLWQSGLSAVLQLGAAVGLLLLVARLFQAKYILSGVPFNMKRYLSAMAGRA